MAWATARSTSRWTCCDPLALAEKIRTISRLWLMPRRMEAAQLSLATMSLGAIQQRMPFASKAAQTASAMDLSLELWLMKTFAGHKNSSMRHGGGRVEGRPGRVPL